MLEAKEENNQKEENDTKEKNNFDKKSIRSLDANSITRKKVKMKSPEIKNIKK